MGKLWIAHRLEEVIKTNRIGQFKLSDVMSGIFNEYSITQQKNGPIDIMSITREAYWVECKDWSRFLYLYSLRIFFENWPETIPSDYNTDEYINFLENRVDTGIENGSLITFVAPTQAPLRDSEGEILFQVIGRSFFVSGSSVKEKSRDERKSIKKAEKLGMQAFLKRGSLVKIDKEESGMIHHLIAKHPDLAELNPVNIYKVDEDAFERVEGRPFDLTL